MRIWFADAFAANVFEGNTAAIVALETWLPDGLMQAIAAENRCAETAFFTPTGLKGNYELRWFTPETEVPLCGHATLAAGQVLLNEIAPGLDMAVFDTRSGPLVVRKNPAGIMLDLPRKPRAPWDAPPELAGALGGVNLVDAFVGEYANVVLPSEQAVRDLKPDIEAIARVIRGPRAGCLTVTAPADEGATYDFVCRFFGPGVGLPEDPVTGSAFADLAPYWCDRLGKKEVTGYQASQRGGFATATQTLSSVRLLGRVAAYLRGELDAGVLAQAPKHGGAARSRETAPSAGPGDDLSVEAHELDAYDDLEVKVLDWESPAPEREEIAVVNLAEPGAAR